VRSIRYHQKLRCILIAVFVVLEIIFGGLRGVFLAVTVSIGLIFLAFEIINIVVFIVLLIISITKVREGFRALKTTVNTWIMNNPSEMWEITSPGFYMVIKKKEIPRK
jgi:Na+/proline symporter